MLQDNIRNQRKKINMSQDELAEKLGVSRQSVSLWETGQAQPTIDNIIALAKIFRVSTDTLLMEPEAPVFVPEKTAANSTATAHQASDKNSKIALVVLIGIVIALVIGLVLLAVMLANNIMNMESTGGPSQSSVTGATEGSSLQSSSTAPSNNTQTSTAPAPSNNTQTSTAPTPSNNTQNSTTPVPSGTSQSTTPPKVPLDLFAVCKEFAIQKGALNGDYCMYQQPSTNYGGYENEYFSLTYWADSNKVEFCLHCPLSDTQSHNFYLSMRGGYNGKYEYVSSKYYRSSGESFRYAFGYIDPAVFYDGYPISCDEYIGSTDGQTDFMEQSRVGICDLIRLIKAFVTVENMPCDFSDFEFVNFQ